MSPVEITLPKLGETVTEGTIVRWCKRVGDRVSLEESLFEVSTDKVDTEIPSPVDGIVAEICVEEGATVAVGTVCVVVNADADVAPARATTATDSNERMAPAAILAPTGRIALSGRTGPKHQLSPLVRRLLREHQIDQADLRGTGRDGRIRREDVQAHIVARTTRAASLVTPAGVARAAAPTQAAVMIAPPAETVVTLLDIDMAPIDRVVRALGTAFHAREDFELTPAPFIARAAIDALHHHPELTAADSATHAPVHLAVLGTTVDAVAIVAHADAKRLAALARGMLGRDREQGSDPATGPLQATFALAIGRAGTQTLRLPLRLPLGGTCPVLAVGGITRRVVPTNDQHGNESITVTPVATFALAHRSDIDGAPFLARLAELIRARRWDDELS